MAFIVFTDTEKPFRFDGDIARKRDNFVLRDSNGVRIYETRQIAAIMREDVAEEYSHAMKELDRWRFGDPADN